MKHAFDASVHLFFFDKIAMSSGVKTLLH